MTKFERTIAAAASGADLKSMSTEALLDLYSAEFDAMDDLPMTLEEIGHGQTLLAEIDAELWARQPLN